jgi:hypothetical protein
MTERSHATHYHVVIGKWHVLTPIIGHFHVALPLELAMTANQNDVLNGIRFG